ncbi:MAG TPA: hypothetical protein VD971_03205 [Phycisphaerales bacterium]|nr:hypothetical protein [Phycisphaerales bacterium]
MTWSNRRSSVSIGSAIASVAWVLGCATACAQTHHTVTVRVLNPTGSPRPSQEVGIWSYAMRDTVVQGKTDVNGQIVLQVPSTFAPGRAFVVLHAGNKYKQSEVDALLTGMAPPVVTPVVLDASAPQSVVVNIPDGIELNVRLVDAQGQPIPTPDAGVGSVLFSNAEEGAEGRVAVRGVPKNQTTWLTVEDRTNWVCGLFQLTPAMTQASGDLAVDIPAPTRLEGRPIRAVVRNLGRCWKPPYRDIFVNCTFLETSGGRAWTFPLFENEDGTSGTVAGRPLGIEHPVQEHPILPNGEYFVLFGQKPGMDWLIDAVWAKVKAGQGQALRDAGVPVLTVTETAPAPEAVADFDAAASTNGCLNAAFPVN